MDEKKFNSDGRYSTPPETEEKQGEEVADPLPVKVIPRRMSVDEMARLHSAGMSMERIGKFSGISRQRVGQLLAEYVEHVGEIEKFRENESTVLHEKRKLLLDAITEEKVNGVKSVRDLTIAYGVLFDKMRLNDGLSSSNVLLGGAGISKWTEIVRKSKAQCEADAVAGERNSSGIDDPDYLARCRKTAQEMGKLDEQLQWERDTRKRLNIPDDEEAK